MKNGQIRWSILCAVITIYLTAFINVFGQEFRGTITGNITDPNGATVPGATVIVKNIETNVATTVKTNDDGSYTVPLLLPGKYSVSVTGDGFKTSVRENIELKVDDRLTIDFTLEIGTQAEVNVVADTDLVERGSVTTGTVTVVEPPAPMTMGLPLLMVVPTIAIPAAWAGGASSRPPATAPATSRAALRMDVDEPPRISHRAGGTAAASCHSHTSRK